MQMDNVESTYSSEPLHDFIVNPPSYLINSSDSYAIIPNSVRSVPKADVRLQSIAFKGCVKVLVCK